MAHPETPMNNESETDRPEPLPMREPGATLRDTPAPDGPTVQLDHHCFTDPTDR